MRNIILTHVIIYINTHRIRIRERIVKSFVRGHTHLDTAKKKRKRTNAHIQT